MEATPKNSVKEISMKFKKDISFLKTHLLSVYDKISLAKNKSLNLFTTDPENYKNQILDTIRNQQEKAPLFGLPIVVKDNFNTVTFPTTAGTPALENFYPKKDASIIKKIKNAGAIIIGKTNMHELAFGITSNNSHFGPVKNPLLPEYFAGGSSGGTAAAIAAKIVEVGLGTDTGGSCRIPAALCGIFGFRPTSGLYDSEGVVPLSITRDTPGLLASTIESIIQFDEIITEQENSEVVQTKTITIGIPRSYFYDNLSEGVEKTTHKAIEKLKQAKINLVEVDIDGLPELLNESINLVLHETAVSLREFLKKYDTEISFEALAAKVASPDVKGLFDSGAINENPNYPEALQEREKLRKLYQNYFEKNNLDAILYPTTPVEASPIENSDETITLNGEQEPTFPTYIRNTNPGSYAGVPSISIPAGKTEEGLPVGIHLEAREKSDKKLLKIAALIHKIIQ